MSRVLLLLASLTIIIFSPHGSYAQIKQIEITSRQPYTENIGPIAYEQITGRLFGEANPEDTGNAIITDLSLAPQNEQGNVEIATDFVLIKPVDMQQSNGALHYMAPNRGRRISPVDSVLMANGAVFLWSAWQGDVDDGQKWLHLEVPVARHADGSSITGPVHVEFIA